MRAVALFAKYPHQDRVRLRLAKFVGYHDAARLRLALFEDNLEIVQTTANEQNTYVAYSFPEEEKYFATYNTPLIYQGEGHIGKRIVTVATTLLEQYNSVILMASDIMNNDPNMVLDVFTKLKNENDVVLAPSIDGSCTLIGMKKLHPIFEETDWSESHVFEEMSKRIKNKGLNLIIYPNLNDIDSIDVLNQVQNTIDYENYKRTNRVLLTLHKEW